MGRWHAPGHTATPRGERTVPDASAVTAAVLDDMREESDELDLLVAGLSAQEWSTPTPAEGWTVAHQIAHLNWTDEVALVAATAPDAFSAEVEKALAAPDTFADEAADEAVTALTPRICSWSGGRAGPGSRKRSARRPGGRNCPGTARP